MIDVQWQRRTEATEAECQRLREAIGGARRRAITARLAVAAAVDPDIRLVLDVQRLLVQEDGATTSTVGAVASDTGAQLGRLSGVWGRAGSGFGLRPLESPPSTAMFSSPDLLEDDPGLLGRELDRLEALAETMERLASTAPPSAASSSHGVLDPFLTAVVETHRADNARARLRAVVRDDRVLAATPDDLGPSYPSSPATVEAAPGRPSYSDEPTGPVPVTSPGPTGERGGSPSRPMILDVVLPLIAVTIVLLVVLSWIG